jgi:hypothetical protein
MDEITEEYKYESRKNYLKEKMSELIREAWFWMAEYELSIEKKESFENQVYIKEKIDNAISTLRKYVNELYYRRRSIKKMEEFSIPRDSIIQAKSIDFHRLVDFHNNYCRCPFHNDTNPSMVLRHNRVRCFSCNKSWDTIQFVMDKDGLSFPQAVKYLLEIA